MQHACPSPCTQARMSNLLGMLLYHVLLVH